jgi:hypothetical protein
LRTRRPHNAAISFLFFFLPALFASWMGCGSGNSSHTSNSSGSGASTASGLGGLGGAGAGGTDGGTDANADTAPSCGSNQKVCDGMCVDQDDPKYGCSPTYCTPCPSYPNASAACMSGQCTLGDCNMGFKNCDGMASNGCETDVTHDPKNCGACGAPCVLVHATPVCDNGMCKVGACDPGGWTDCSGADGGAGDGGAGPDIGCTTNTQNDPKNCGGCGSTCPGLETCENGMCGLVCPKGYADCNHDPSDGCETQLGTNKNCNFCGDTCNLPNSQSQCQMMMPTNVCNLLGCDAGFANCDMIAMNGCETNTNTNANNCGSCGNQCPYGPHSTAICTNGGCGLVCDAGYADCNNNPTDGCEVNIDNGDPNNCGMCGKQCSTNHATETCTAGLCAIVTCQSGWADCDKSASDGCEVNTQQGDPNNCGTCGTICTTQNGTPACSQGMCAVGSCNPGFAHCPGQPGTNCETSTGTDVNNCGACSNKCSTNNATPICTGGMCILMCNPLFGDCDGNVTNGCETSTTTVQHCGTCTTVCTTQNGTPACTVMGTTATCGVAGCSTGYANCPGNGTNCSTFIGGSDVNNCGACNHVCPGDATNPNLHDTGTCTGGMCGFICDPGYGNCNGNTVDGCEANLATDPNNCSACANSCVAQCGGTAGHVIGGACSGGTCSISTCAAGWDDHDKLCSDGCECQDSTTTSTCGGGGATVLSLGVTFSSNMYPASPNAAYFTVSFTGSNQSLNYHPKITLTDPLGEFVMDVTTDCATFVSSGGSSDACNGAGDNGNSNGVVTWETSYIGPVPQADPSHPAEFQAIPPRGTVYVKVYRKVPMTSCNNKYMLTATD